MPGQGEVLQILGAAGLGNTPAAVPSNCYASSGQDETACTSGDTVICSVQFTVGAGGANVDAQGFFNYTPGNDLITDNNTMIFRDSSDGDTSIVIPSDPVNTAIAVTEETVIHLTTPGFHTFSLVYGAISTGIGHDTVHLSRLVACITQL